MEHMDEGRDSRGQLSRVLCRIVLAAMAGAPATTSGRSGNDDDTTPSAGTGGASLDAGGQSGGTGGAPADSGSEDGGGGGTEPPERGWCCATTGDVCLCRDDQLLPCGYNGLNCPASHTCCVQGPDSDGNHCGCYTDDYVSIGNRTCGELAQDPGETIVSYCPPS